MSDPLDHRTLVPGFPKGQDVGILAKAPWSPAIPQESGLGDAFEDRVPPIGRWGERRIRGLRPVDPIAERGRRGEDDVERGRRSCRSRREPQNLETSVLGIDGNDAEVVSSRPRRDGCVDNGTRWDPSTHRASGGRWHRTGGARPGSDRELFVWVAAISGRGRVVLTMCARRRRQ